MSAENAWRIAREILATMPTKYLARCPMPPAFRAEVEAEAEELRGMLRQARDALNDAREELEEYEADATGECYNRPSLNWALERIDAVLFPPRRPEGEP